MKSQFFRSKDRMESKKEEREKHFYSVGKQTHKKVQHNFWKICVNKCYFFLKNKFEVFVC